MGIPIAATKASLTPKTKSKIKNTKKTAITPFLERFIISFSASLPRFMVIL